MSVPTITFNVSGVAMSVMSGSELVQRPHRYDPTDFPEETIRAGKALSDAPARRAGRGRTHTVTTDPAAAGVIWQYCMTVGDTFVGDSDSDTRRDGRALLAVADTIAARIRAAGWTEPTHNDLPRPF